jgi:hypothetical protein
MTTKNASRPLRLKAPPAWLVVGAKVNYHALIRGPATQTGLTVTEAPFKSLAGEWVVFLDGVRGYVAIEACSRAQEVA